MKENINLNGIKDEELTCVECGLPFTFDVGEAQFFQQKGLAKPKRCKPCRSFRRSTLIRDDTWGVNDGG